LFSFTMIPVVEAFDLTGVMSFNSSSDSLNRPLAVVEGGGS
jgi:hypothetical protein